MADPAVSREAATAPAEAIQPRPAHQPFASACYAPFVSMYFDTLGFVRACCQNWTQTLGNIAHQRLPDIWRGPRAEALREALRNGDYGLGCQYCGWQVAEGPPSAVFARNFDHLPAGAEPADLWPAQIEFSLTNLCNLECVMCNGEWSSRIRAGRERLPPLPEMYGDQFFSDLAPFLRRVRYLKFLGGEPLLAPHTYRIWDQLAAEGLSVACHVTTNGTQYNRRIEAAMESHPISFAVSVDGVTAETVESIRRGARWSTILENLARFRAYAAERGTTVTLTYCLMPQNWHELGSLMLQADDWGCDVVVNTVLFPPAHSLYHLPTAQLREIVAALATESASIESRLTKNRPRWLDQLQRLRQRAEHGDQAWLAQIPRRTTEFFADLAEPGVPDAARPPAPSLPVENEIWLDADDRVVAAPPGATLADLPPGELLGRPLDQVYALMRNRWGGVMQIDPLRADGDSVWQRWSFQNARLQTVQFLAQIAPRRGAQGELLGTRLLLMPAPSESELTS